MMFEYPDSYFFPVENDDSYDAIRIRSMLRQSDEEYAGLDYDYYDLLMNEADEEYARKCMNRS